MTSAERLIKNLCEDALSTIDEHAKREREDVPSSTLLTRAPARVQRAAAVLRRLRPQVTRAERTIENAGYRAPVTGDKRIMLGYQEEKKRKREIDDEHQRRRQRVKSLRTNAEAAVIGRKPEEAGDIVRALQTALKKV